MSDVTPVSGHVKAGAATSSHVMLRQNYSAPGHAQYYEYHSDYGLQHFRTVSYRNFYEMISSSLCYSEMVSLSFILNGLSINPPDQYQRFIMIFYHQIEFLICLGIFANQPMCKKRVNQPIISWIQVDLSSPNIEFSCARTLWGLDWAIQNIKLLLGLS